MQAIFLYKKLIWRGGKYESKLFGFKRLRRQATNWKKIFTKDISDKEPLYNKKTNNPIKNWAKKQNRYWTKKIYANGKWSYEKMFDNICH